MPAACSTRVPKSDDGVPLGEWKVYELCTNIDHDKFSASSVTSQWPDRAAQGALQRWLCRSKCRSGARLTAYSRGYAADYYNCNSHVSACYSPAAGWNDITPQTPPQTMSALSSPTTAVRSLQWPGPTGKENTSTDDQLVIPLNPNVALPRWTLIALRRYSLSRFNGH